MAEWRALLRQRLPDADPEVLEELAQHLEVECAELVARGASDDAARDTLLRQLDDGSHVLTDALRRRHIRRRRTAGFTRGTWHDARHGWRALRRTPAFSAVMILSLAIVIGANTAIFGLLHAVLLRRLPVPHPEQLVALRPVNRGYKVDFNYDNYKTFIKTSGLSHVEAYRLDAATVTVGAERIDLWLEMVSGGYFDLIDVPPMLGRTLSRHDDSTHTAAAVVSEDFWRQHLGADRHAIGRAIDVNGARYMLVGIMPRSYGGIFFAHNFTIAVPLTTASLFDSNPELRGVAMLTRASNGAADPALRDRASLAYRRCCLQPTEQRNALASRRGGPPRPDDAPTSAFGFWEDTTDATPHVQVLDMSHGLTWSTDFRAQYGTVLVALMAGVIVLLLVACTNVGTLLLSRAAAREREFAVRMSLGASRMRMIRQLLIETLELSLIGTVLGIALAWIGTMLLLHALPSNAIQLSDVIAWRASPTILVFTIVTMFVCTLLAGLWPAHRAARADILASLTGAGRALNRGRGWRLERGLVGMQIALALVLASMAALLAATLRNLERGDGGYHTRQALLARVDLRGVVTDSQLPRVAQALLTGGQRLPGVEAAAVSFAAPVINDLITMLHVEVPGYVATPNEPPPYLNAVSAGYFSATGIGLAAGRDFDTRDIDGRELVAIVSEAFNKHYFPNRNPIGASLIVSAGRQRRTARIVGIARDAHYDDLHRAPREMWYLPLDQTLPFDHVPSFVLSLRTEVDPVSVAPSVRRMIRGIAPQAEIRRIASVGQLLDDALARERFAAAIATLFGTVALILATMGVYGVIAYNVARRTPEIGIRMALGARPRDALWLVMRQTLTIAAIGLIIGAPLAFAVGRALASQLYGIDGRDPRVFLGAALVLALAAALAGLLPSTRAARVDPSVALRAE